MARIVSVHEYVLKAGVSEKDFEVALRKARTDRLFDLPGLVDCYFVRGIRGKRRRNYAAVWVYESRKAWERIWGPPDHPPPKENFPENWKTWEDDVLAPFLDRDPDAISYTTYQEF